MRAGSPRRALVRSREVHRDRKPLSCLSRGGAREAPGPAPAARSRRRFSAAAGASMKPSATAIKHLAAAPAIVRSQMDPLPLVPYERLRQPQKSRGMVH